MARDKRTHTIRGYGPEYIRLELKMRALKANCSESEALLDILCLHFYKCTFAEHESKDRRAALGAQANSLT